MPREALLVRTLVELADNLVEDFDVIDVLTVLSDRCVEVLDVDSAGVMLAAPGGELQVVASSSAAMRGLELFELQANEGPCVDCFVSGQPIVNLELSAIDDRWPRFARRAVADGFHSVHALPMHLRGSTVGALNLFRMSEGSLRADDVVAAQALADVATIAIIQHKAAVGAAVLNTQLSEALDSRIIIEQAKGKVSEASGLDMDRSFQRIRTHARNHNLRLTELARGIADGTTSIVGLDPLPRTRQARSVTSSPWSGADATRSGVGCTWRGCAASSPNRTSSESNRRSRPPVTMQPTWSSPWNTTRRPLPARGHPRRSRCDTSLA